MTSDAARGAAVQPERLKPLHLVALGGEPSEGRPRDDVIEREEPAHEDDRGRGLRPAVSHVGDAKRLIDGLAGEQHGARAAGEDGPLVLDGELLLDESADEPQQAFTVVAGLEVHPTLRARKRAAMQGDQGQPFGLAASPSEGRELAGAVLQRRDRGGALGARVDLGRAAGHRVTSARSPRPSGLRIPLGVTIIRARSRVGIHGQGRARVQRSRRRRGGSAAPAFSCWSSNL